jgi:hypothetical protein
MNYFLKILPSIASHPLALVAYVSVAGAWLLTFYRRQKSIDFLKTLELLPESDRITFCDKSKYRYDELAALPEKDRLKLLTKRYRLIAYIVTVIGVSLLVASGIMVKQRYADELAKGFALIQNGNNTLEGAITNLLAVVQQNGNVDTAARMAALQSALERVRNAHDSLRDEIAAFIDRYGGQTTPEIDQLIDSARQRLAMVDKFSETLAQANRAIETTHSQVDGAAIPSNVDLSMPPEQPSTSPGPSNASPLVVSPPSAAAVTNPPPAATVAMPGAPMLSRGGQSGGGMVQTNKIPIDKTLTNGGQTTFSVLVTNGVSRGPNVPINLQVRPIASSPSAGTIASNPPSIDSSSDSRPFPPFNLVARPVLDTNE